MQLQVQNLFEDINKVSEIYFKSLDCALNKTTDLEITQTFKKILMTLKLKQIII